MLAVITFNIGQEDSSKNVQLNFILMIYFVALIQTLFFPVLYYEKDMKNPQYVINDVENSNRIIMHFIKLKNFLCLGT